VLWVLPLAASRRAHAGGWLLLAALVPLQYLQREEDVTWPCGRGSCCRLSLDVVDSWRAWRRRRPAPDAT
jgi:hypothetical protein